MKNDRRMIAYIIYIIFGAVLMVLGVLEVVDSFWSGMGGALIAMGAVRVIQFLRYKKTNLIAKNGMWKHRTSATILSATKRGHGPDICLF